MIVCEICMSFGMEGVDFEDFGSGEDEHGEFTDWECLECGHLNRVYDNAE